MVYDEIRFGFAEDLPEDLKRCTDIRKGLVVVKAKIGSIPKYEIESVVGSPSDYIKNLAKKEKINMEKIFSKFKDE